MTRSLASIAAVLACVSLAHAQSTAPHPRLILDATTLATLRSRAASNTPQWQRLKNYCDSFIGGNVNNPLPDNSENDYPDAPDIGQGYEGDGYWAPLWSEALCYQAVRLSDPTNAAKYGAKAADMAVKMSLPTNMQGEDPCKDDGYVMRFFGVGMGILYDWVYDVLTPTQRTQIYTTANAWQTSWETPDGCSAFAYGNPVGNYFAGFFHAKTVMALATAGDNPSSASEWTDWQTTQYQTAPSNPPHLGVQPYYAAHMAGGGWPEGFGNYGPLATLNMSLPAWEVKTATGTDLVNAAAPYTFPIDAGDYLMHFTWPTRAYIDDRDTNHSNGDADAPPPSSTDPGMFMQALGVQRYWNAPHANVLQEYTNEVVAAREAIDSGSDDVDAWEEFLFYDPNGATSSLSTLPLSYFATGPNAVAARSDWSNTATWMSFRAGAYVDGQGAGEEGFDQGSLALVRGGTPLLVNGTGWAVHEPGGNVDETNVYNDEYGEFDPTNIYFGNRTIYNIFYVRKMSANEPVTAYGQLAESAEDGARTQVAAFEDGSTYVYTLATHLEDMYRLDENNNAQVAAWSREIVYLRPSRFLVYDRTTAGNASGGNTASDQFLAFHFPANPASVSAPAGEQRFDITYDATYAGAITTVLPANTTTQIIGMYPPVPPDYDGSTNVKVWQLQIRAPTSAASQSWLTAFDLATSATSVATASAVDVTSANTVGALLVAASGNETVLFNNGAPNTTIAGTVTYSVPTANTTHFITELPPDTGYSIAVVVADSTHTITVTPGGSFTTSANGVLSFNVSAAGTVTVGDRIFADGFGG